MDAAANEVHEYHIEEASYEERTKRNRLGLWLFLFSEIFLFGAFLAARYFLWGSTRPELNQFVGLLTTSVLLLSSFFMNRAETAIGYDNRTRFLRSLLITAALGIAFLIGVVGIEWADIKPADGVYGAVFFGMTGLHSLHVVSGVILIFIIWYRGRKGAFSAEEHWGVEAAATYWHYVDVIWVFFYPALYLIGTAV
ncbi:MAG: heme-copper oxidase subunit III [Candidatus Promineifilaceae bacterium]|jgi:cytochrome c oxidase subunit 3